jgi:hypothetical protein
MLSTIIAWAINHQFATGLLIGGCLVGGILGIAGWFLGYESALRSINSCIRRRAESDFGEIPNLPPVRDRRHFPTTPGRWG